MNFTILQPLDDASGVMDKLEKKSIVEFLESCEYTETDIFNVKTLHSSDIQFFNYLTSFYSKHSDGQSEMMCEMLNQECMSVQEFIQSDGKATDSSKDARPRPPGINQHSKATKAIVTRDMCKLHLEELRALLISVTACATISCQIHCSINMTSEMSKIFQAFNSEDAFLEELLMEFEGKLLNINALLALCSISFAKPELYIGKHFPFSIELNNDVTIASHNFNESLYRYEQLEFNTRLSPLSSDKVDIVHKNVMEKLKTLSTETSSLTNK